MYRINSFDYFLDNLVFCGKQALLVLQSIEKIIEKCGNEVGR